MENTDLQNTGAPKAQDDKTIGILSYIIWIVAYILYRNKKSEYNTFHVRQGLGLFILWVGVYIFFSIVLVVLGRLYFLSFILTFVSSLVYLALLILAILGIVNANDGKQKELPVIGKYISDMLKNFK
jgi:uncharacterized membrane protein